jgi:hypothetical protein
VCIEQVAEYFCTGLCWDRRISDDSIGLVADNLAQPINYLGLSSLERLNYAGVFYLNRLSLSSDAYEEMKKYSVDPYASVREAYHEYRNARIKWNRQHQTMLHRQSGPVFFLVLIKKYSRILRKNREKNHNPT